MRAAFNGINIIGKRFWFFLISALIIVPGIAFDKNNMRLGRGHGYYDRFLSGIPNKTKTIGLAFDCQVVEDLPKDSHDIPVWKTITA